MNEVPGQNIKRAESVGARQFTVVVVDDSATMRAIIKKELEPAGFIVVAFNDGLDALSALQSMRKPPDLITMDIDMPRMDGFVCCEKIREMEARGFFGNQKVHIPVLFVSANDTFENRSRGFHLGSLEFIKKPFVRGDIALAVSRVLRPQSIFAGMTVLVVDDNPSIRRMVSACLQRIGLGIIEANDGLQAFDIIKKDINLIDLGIVDFDMPVMRGDEFIHLARQLPEAEHVPLLSLSGSGDNNKVLQMFRAGATDYLVKPFIVEELLARVQVHLHLRRRVRSLEEMNKDLYDKAVNDSLTGLRNKLYFQEAFEEMFVSAQRIGIDSSCLFFDLDHFKKVNDTCGHGFGDYVLKTIGRLVKENVRFGDLAARIGGEEFVVVLPNASLDDARAVAERFRTQVEGHLFKDKEHQWPVTVSVGVSSLRANKPSTASNLLELADQALYRAKSTGRNRVVTYQE
jgi:two-component system cell cycle response regulator